jgi:Phycobilisome degradation protein nblA
MEKTKCSYELSMEQQFQLVQVSKVVEGMSKAQLVEYYMELARAFMTTQNAAKCMLREQLGTL